MAGAAAVSQATERPEARPRAAPRRFALAIEALALVVAISLNWWAAASLASPAFSYTSAALFAWIVVLMIRIQPRGAVIALPLIITRAATISSLIFIEAGAYLPEVGRTGAPGDASASFVAYTAILLATYTLVFSAFERWVVRHAQSQLLNNLNALLRWPVIGLCAGAALLALLHGAQTGFPLLEGVDRFHYRRYEAGGVLALLDYKFVLAVLLGVTAFSRASRPLERVAAGGVYVLLTGVFFLFGDKFFTILTAFAYFLMPYLLQRERHLLSALAKAAPIALAALAVSFAATLYTYSDFGRAPASKGFEQLGERMAGQGELWFVATQDNRRLTNWDHRLVAGYQAGLDHPDPPASAFRQGVETYYFVYKYAPRALMESFRANQGWVQLTMGFEAMGLVMFGYLGLTVLMVLGGVLVALPALSLLRALRSEFALSLAFSVWISLQAYLTVQQASLWATFAVGQLRRFLVGVAMEVMIFAFNRGQNLAVARDQRTFRRPSPRLQRARHVD